MDAYGIYSYEDGSNKYRIIEFSEPYKQWNKNPTAVIHSSFSEDSFPPIVLPPSPRDDPANRERAEIYAKRALRHFNSVEDTRLEFKGLISFNLYEPDTWAINFYANQPEEGATAVRFGADVVQDEVRGCGVCAPYELIAELQVKHAISKYNKEKGAAYEVVEILRYHDNLIYGDTRRGHWNHYNFTAVSRSRSDKSPVQFFAEVNAVTPLGPEEIGCCIVDPQHPDATYDCEICPRHKNICHPFHSPVGGLVRGPAFAACHHDGSDIIHCCDILRFS